MTSFRKTKRLRGKRVAVLAADGFEYVELRIPVSALRRAGAIVEIISLHRGKIRGMNLTEPTRKARVDLTLDEANPAHYDALLVPGGFIGPDLLRQSERARAFVRALDEARKPIATLCHGPWLLASAELVAGRRLAAWPGIRDDLVHAGAVWRDEPLVRDGNWVTSRGPQDLHAFVPAMIELFAEEAHATEAVPVPSDGESSPKYERPLGLAVMAARVLPGPFVGTMASAVAFTALGTAALRRAL